MLKSPDSLPKSAVTAGSESRRPSARVVSIPQPSQSPPYGSIILPIIRQVEPRSLSEMLSSSPSEVRDQEDSTETRPNPASLLDKYRPELKSPSTDAASTPTSDLPSKSSPPKFELVKTPLSAERKRGNVEIKLAPVSEETRSELTKFGTESLQITELTASLGSNESWEESWFSPDKQPDPDNLLDRCSPQRIVLLIKRRMREFLDIVRFEPNDELTRECLNLSMKDFLRTLVSRKGLHDFMVLNITPISPRILVAIRITKDSKWIYIQEKL